MAGPPSPEDSGLVQREQLREVGDVVRRLALGIDLYAAAVSRVTGHHTADVHAVGAIKRAVEEGRPLTAGALGRLLGLSPAAVTAMLGRMERAGHVRRVRGGPDGRRVYLETGSRSDDDSRHHFQALNQAYGEVLGEYSSAELALVHHVLARLERATEQACRDVPRQGVADEEA